jgi:hypothetical protein
MRGSLNSQPFRVSPHAGSVVPNHHRPNPGLRSPALPPIGRGFSFGNAGRTRPAVVPLQRLWQPDLAPPSPAGLFFGRHRRRETWHRTLNAIERLQAKAGGEGALDGPGCSSESA